MLFFFLFHVILWSNVNYLKVFAMNGSVVGNVSKQWTGAVKEVFTEADNFGVTCAYWIVLNSYIIVIYIDYQIIHKM